MRKNIKLLGAITVAGVVAATGSAFTGTGITNNAGTAAFVGGTVQQTVNGAELDAVQYVTSGDGTVVTDVKLTFAVALDATEQAVSVKYNGTTDGTCTGGTTVFTCAVPGAITSINTLDITVAGADAVAPVV